MKRVILHSDCNSFYASVECRNHPALRGKPVAVAGSVEDRHGIILAKTPEAAKYGVQTAEPIFQAQQKCPNLILVPPHFEEYVKISKQIRTFYDTLTDRVEPFGLDECWLDLTGCPCGGEEAAERIRRFAKEEIGITVSVGVSFNKAFAKLGSDLQKPDATTVITEENFREKLWQLPLSTLLFAGRATTAKLARYEIHTIGDLARTDPALLRIWLGKNGDLLWRYANGLDRSLVCEAAADTVKSVGNGYTPYRDLTSADDIRMMLYHLSEQVARRLRQLQKKALNIRLSLRLPSLERHSMQRKLSLPVNRSPQIAEAAWDLFLQNRTDFVIRSLTVTATELIPAQEGFFCSLLEDPAQTARLQQLDEAMDHLKNRYGEQIVRRGITMRDPRCCGLDPAFPKPFSDA